MGRAGGEIVSVVYSTESPAPRSKARPVAMLPLLVILFVVDKTIGLRVSPEEEREGLDLSQHGEEGYEWAH